MLASTFNRLAEFGRDVAAFCYPCTCEVCGKAAIANEILCVKCAAELAQLRDEPYCELCGNSLSEAGAPCAYCLGKGVAHFDRVIRLGLFRDPLKRVVHHAKYHRRWPLAEAMADQLLLRAEHAETLRAADVIIPVPLHPIRQFQRGYNQADVIARRLGRAVKRPVVHPVDRVRSTSTQTGLHSHARRIENLRGAFAVMSEHDIRDRHVIVVDDVMTTGATLQSFARTIKVCEPKTLTALVLAVADPRHNDFQSI